jgi:hypothetical protein
VKGHLMVDISLVEGCPIELGKLSLFFFDLIR